MRRDVGWVRPRPKIAGFGRSGASRRKYKFKPAPTTALDRFDMPPKPEKIGADGLTRRQRYVKK